MMYVGYYSSPVGLLRVASDGKALVECSFAEKKVSEPEADGLVTVCIRELDEFFAGKRCVFTLPLNMSGTDFQKRVWTELQRIPYGETISYKTLAQRIGAPKAVRAVGGANHHNPIVIIIPCHRVVGANGKLTGYGGGLDKKEFLLQLEESNKKAITIA